MNTFKKLPVKDFPVPELKKESAEQAYWKEFQFPTVVKEFSAINHVDISPIKPYNALVTCSGKVQIFNRVSNEVIRKSTRPKENIYGARYRSDGSLMVTGGDSGLVQVLDVNSRSILRNLRGHSGPTKVCSFANKEAKVYSASDDQTVQQWDLATGKGIKSYKAATDFIRCGCIYPKNDDQFITGSYDHTVKLWDFRSDGNKEVLSLDHEAPVEYVLVHSAGGICISSGSNYIKVWDIAAGGRMLFRFSNHLKTITTLCFDGDETRLLSGSLDRNVKIYNVLDYTMVASLSYPSPILAMGLSKDDSYFVVGMADGAISLQNRVKEKDQKRTGPKRSFNLTYNFEKRLDKYKLRPVYEDKRIRYEPGTKEYLEKDAVTAMPKKSDVVVKDTKRVATRFTRIDNLLRKFRYQESIAASVEKCNDDMILSLLIELDRRDALEVALKEQTTNTLNLFVDFLSRNISNLKYTKTLQPVASLLLDIYTPLMVADSGFLAQLEKLNKKLKSDLLACQEMMKLMGVIEQIYIMSTPPPRPEKEPQLKILNSQKDKNIENDKVEEKGEKSNEKLQEMETEKSDIEPDQDTDVDFEIKETNTEITIEDDST